MEACSVCKKLKKSVAVRDTFDEQKILICNRCLFIKGIYIIVPFVLLVICGTIAVIYGCLTNLDFLEGTLIIVALLSFLIFCVVKQYKWFSRLFISFYGFWFLMMAISCVSYVYNDVHSKFMVKDINTSDVKSSLLKSRAEVQNTFDNMRGSINELKKSRDQIDALVIQAETTQNKFLQQISALNNAEDVSNKLDSDSKHFKEVLSNVEKEVGGEKVFTIQDYQQEQFKDTVIGFLLGILSGILAAYIFEFFRRKNKA